MLGVPIGASASAQAQRSISIPAGSLYAALRQLARQTGITVGGTVRGMARLRTPAVRGDMSAEEALRMLLAATPYEAIRSGARTFRIERRNIRSERPASASTTPANAQPSPPAAPPQPIIVTASKRETGYDDYAGSATVADLDDALPGTQSGGLEHLLAALPVISSTELGPGRNKLFIRGVADSSFNGPTQSTIGLYFGEHRLIYSAPNPDLRLYDVERVELLEGPQGTLYGTGALGGILRLTPRHAAPGEWEARLWASTSLTAGGEPSYDLAGLVNVPLGNSAAIRILGYNGRTGGYIDDSLRRLTNVNRTLTEGWRATLRTDFGDGWTVDIDGLGQLLDTRDGQYADEGLLPLTRRSRIAQPFDSDIIGGGVTVRKDWGDLDLVSATGVFRSDLGTRFDASGLSSTGDLLAFDEDRRIDLVTHETRLSQNSTGDYSWVLGVSGVVNVERRTQALGDPDAPALLIALRDTTNEAALFGEASVSLSDRWNATLGGRIVLSESLSEKILVSGVEFEPRVTAFRFLPTAAISWRPDERLFAYLRYQRGYRAGGVSVEGATDSNPQIDRFEPDGLETIELGARLNLRDIMRTELSVAGFVTRWSNIQADRIDERGFPLTSNIGDGRIYGMTASATVRPIEAVSLSGALFLNQTHFSAAPNVIAGTEGQLPNVAEIGARTNITVTAPVSDHARIEALVGLDYHGESILGLEPFLEIPQGGYFEAKAAIAYRTESWSIALEAANLANARSNRFAFGNPFLVGNARQTTPLRPREIKLSAAIRF